MNARDFQLIALCGFIHNRQAFSQLGPDLNEDLFTEPDLQAAYDAMIRSGEKFTVPEVASMIEEHGGLSLMRDIRTSYRRYGLNKDFTVQEVEKYAKAVEKLGRLHHIRTLLKTSMDVLDDDKQRNLLGLKDDEVISKLIDGLVGEQYGRRRSGFQHYDVYLSQLKTRFRHILAGEPPLDRMQTHMRSFDKATGGGLPVPGLTVVAGQPGSGKTQLAWQWVLDKASHLRADSLPGICAVNSAEMTGLSLASRAVLSGAGIDSSLFRTGGYNTDKQALHNIARELRRQAGLPIYIDDSEFLTSNIISSRVSGLKALYKDVVLVITDFAELVRDPGESQEQRVASVFLNAKALSKRLNCAVVLLSQVNKAVELSGTRVPSMKNLRYTDMAAAIADLIVLIYNPNMYIDSGVKITPHPDMPPRPGTAYLVIGKHREGEIGILSMGWEPVFTRWGDLGPKTLLKKQGAE